MYIYFGLEIYFYALMFFIFILELPVVLLFDIKV